MSVLQFDTGTPPLPLSRRTALLPRPLLPPLRLPDSIIPSSPSPLMISPDLIVVRILWLLAIGCIRTLARDNLDLGTSDCFSTR